MSELPTIDWWGDGIKAYPDNDMMKSGAVPSQSLVVQEHQTLINHIANLGFDIVFIPFSQQLEDAKKYDFVFTRDHFMCNTKKEVVISNMKLPQRLEETDFVKKTLSDLGYTVKTLPENAHIAEGGEFFYLPNENMLLAGCSRNNQAGAEKVAELMGVNSLHIIISEGYHLDTAISPIFNQHHDCIGLMSAEEVFDNNNYQFLKDLCKHNNWELLAQLNTEKEKSLKARAAMNCLTLPGILISTAEIDDDRTIEFINNNNIRFIVSDVSQFNLSGGSVHCLTNELF